MFLNLTKKYTPNNIRATHIRGTIFEDMRVLKPMKEQLLPKQNGTLALSIKTNTKSMINETMYSPNLLNCSEIFIIILLFSDDIVAFSTLQI